MNAEILELPIKKKKIWQRVGSNLVLHTVSGVYYVRKKRQGKGELFKSTGLMTKKAAQTMADEMVSEWIGGKLKLTRSKNVTEVCDEVEVVLRKKHENKDRARSTFYEHDLIYLPILKKYFGSLGIDEIDEKSWDDWVRTTGKSLSRNLNDIAKYLSIILTYAHRSKYINRKPMIYSPDKKKKSG